MVVFTCNNCGEAVKKPAVEKHYMSKCRGPPDMTCIDCLKDFRGNEYEAHIKCFSEEERYAAKGFVAKPNSNKGEKKQQTWFESVQNILETDKKLKPDEKELLQILSAHENLPRKRGKFINFLTNAHRAYARREDLVNRVWTIIEEAGKAATVVTRPNANGTAEKDGDAKANGTNEAEEKVVEDQHSKDKKRKKEKGVADEEPHEPQNGTTKHSKKSKRKAEAPEDDADDAKKIKVEATPNLLRTILGTGGETISIYKLNQTLEKHCASVAGVEKAGKMLKKIQKQILLTVSGHSIVVNDDLLNA